MGPRDWLTLLDALPHAPGCTPTPPGMASATAAHDLDALAWRAWHRTGELPWDSIRPSGALLEQGLFRTIEVWTESELSLVHLLERGADGPEARRSAERIHDAVGWHLAHTQPDNATNRPWAVHVFALDGRAEASLYAQTLLHNAQAGGAMGDPLVAWILADAAQRLRVRLGA